MNILYVPTSGNLLVILLSYITLRRPRRIDLKSFYSHGFLGNHFAKDILLVIRYENYDVCLNRYIDIIVREMAVTCSNVLTTKTAHS